MRRVILTFALFFLVGCTPTDEMERRQEYIDRCIIEAGPQPERNNVSEYCRAKFRQSERDKE